MNDFEQFTDRETQLVHAAAKRATNTLRRRDRWDRAITFFLVGVAVAATVSILVTYKITHENDSHQHAAEVNNARRNCGLITKIAKVQLERIVENKASTERFKKESLDRFGLSPKQFDKLVKEGEAREQRQLAAYETVASVNCTNAIR